VGELFITSPDALRTFQLLARYTWCHESIRGVLLTSKKKKVANHKRKNGCGISGFGPEKNPHKTDAND